MVARRGPAIVHKYAHDSAVPGRAVSLCHEKGRMTVLKKRTTDNWEAVTCPKCHRIRKPPQNVG